MTAIITSVDLVGTPTHFWHGRTVPCEVTDCTPCNDGVPWRWHGYFAAWQPTDHLHFLFEFTARASQAFLDYRKVYSTLRGCHFRVHRVNASPNGRVVTETKPADLSQFKLPQPPDLIKVLSIIWNIATPCMDVEGLMKNLPRVRIDATGSATPLAPEPPGNGRQHAPQ